MDYSNLYRRGETYYARIQRNGHDDRVSLRTKDLETAQTRVEALLRASDAEREVTVESAFRHTFIYFMFNPVTQTVKIGFSDKPKRRLAEAQCYSADRLELLGAIPAERATERLLHQFLSAYWKSGEWFTAPKEVLDFIAAILQLKPAPGSHTRHKSRITKKASNPLVGKLLIRNKRLAGLAQW